MPETEERARLRKLTWEKNSFIGHATMGRRQMLAIVDHELVPGDAKVQAMRVKIELEKLEEMLRRKEAKP